MSTENIANMSVDQLKYELKNGTRFVVFPFCISILIMTFKKNSKVHMVRKDEGVFGNALLYTLISLLFGWWGIPWGPIYTISSIFSNITGGKDVTQEMVDALVQNGTLADGEITVV